LKAAPFLVVAGVLLSAVPARADLLLLPVTLRDFSSAHPDFEAGIFLDDLDIVGPLGSAIGGDGTPVYAGGGGGTPTTTGPAPFADWYHDTAANSTLPAVHPASFLTLDNGMVGPGGVYTFTDLEYFPLDGLLGGNEGRAHNYHFTMELHSTFTYEVGQSFTFTGDDDVFLYIDGELVMNLGGVHTARTGTVDLDTLGLTPGEDYAFDFFFAERHTFFSEMQIETGIQFVEVPEPGVAMMLAVGSAVGLLRRRRRT